MRNQHRVRCARPNLWAFLLFFSKKKKSSLEDEGKTRCFHQKSNGTFPTDPYISKILYRAIRYSGFFRGPLVTWVRPLVISWIVWPPSFFWSMSFTTGDVSSTKCLPTARNYIKHFATNAAVTNVLRALSPRKITSI